MRSAALSLLILAMAGPQLGITRNETYTPSTDTITVTDLSGSMDEKMGGGMTSFRPPPRRSRPMSSISAKEPPTGSAW